MIDPFQETGVHYTSLNEHHQMAAARTINLERLKEHLLFDHGVGVDGVRTKSEAGRLHTFVHAILAYDDLSQLMELPEGYGTGKYVPQKH